MTYKSDKLNLQSQSIAGVRHWAYTDTGTLKAAVFGSDSFFADGKSKGMRVGDVVFVSNSATGLGDVGIVNSVQADDTGGQYAGVGDTG